MSGELIVPWDGRHEEYLQDESRSTGTAESISFPKTEAEVLDVVREIGARGGSITVQGARTGITAGAVPGGGHVLNLQRMNAIGEVRREAEGEGARLTVQPGALLQDIYEVVEGEGLFFPPDPTEASASIGGAVACNASGAMSFHYGPTRRWVRSLRLVLGDGSTLSMARGEHRAQGRSFSLSTDSGETISGQLPSYTVPSVKSAAGYYVADDMDLLDLFIGMEGTLGIVTEAELVLIPRPAAVLGLTAFLPSEEAALQFVRALRERGGDAAGSVPTVAIEFFDRAALDLLRRAKAENPAFESLPPLAEHFHTAVYCEFHAEDEGLVEEVTLQVLDTLVEVGGNDEDTWASGTRSPRR
jgi:D-lactate dehydrogenase (cytochrome)